MKQQYYLALTKEEWRLISESRYTDAVDEVLVKVANAKIKKSRLKNGGLEYGKVHYRRTHRA